MKIRKHCPTHGRIPGYIIWRYPERKITTKMEGEELVTTVYYTYCQCRFEERTPVKGKIAKDGYVYISTDDGYQSQHRYVWEQAHGKLGKGYVIHHINGVRSDNRLENLIALPKSQHNNNIPEPFEIYCPYCNEKISVIKQARKTPIVMKC